MLQRIWIFSTFLALIACFPESDPNADDDGASSSGGRIATATGGAPAGNSGGETDTGGKPATGGTSSSGGSDPLPEGGSTNTPDPSTPDAGAGGAPEVEPTGKCLPPQSSALIPARSSVLSTDVPTGDTVIFVDSILAEFKVHCGQCHVERTYGGFHVADSPADFAAKVTRDVVENAIKATTLEKSMPQPDPILYSQRSADDPIVHLVSQLQLWLDAGSPTDVIRIPRKPGEGQSPYLMAPSVGSALTNLGSCVPERNFPIAWGKPFREQMDELDTLFAGLHRKTPKAGEALPGEQVLGLPLHLADTDLFSFDSEELARYGVVAFAPGYPLWSDGSAKLRHLRVPRGQSIHFDKSTQEFTIPPNTRFYKTFLKQVVDKQGLRRYRKIETRLIVSRPDTASGEVTALFGTYRWNDDETDATLVTDGRRDKTPFKDLVFYYTTDEPKAAEIANRDPPVRNLTYEWVKAGAIRHYAIPGADRCVQCHMGSVRADFVLGFTPMQIARRPRWTGGVIEPGSPDEYSQLERLVGLGIITGVDSPADIVPLENSQLGDPSGPRKPRNDEELVAQGYLFGNCGHCHNPRGYASVSVPMLKDLLRFWPNSQGGIFQFPLERFSPRITRGVEGRPIPYITPSLRDLLPFDWDPTSPVYTPKFAFGESTEVPPTFLDAPWRSLIYRNTQASFTYAEDFTIYPHMPMNTAGHDCRASQLLGTWMVSIPSRRKTALKFVSDDFVDPAGHNPGPKGSSAVNNLSQPYEEVVPAANGYLLAVADAERRLRQFKSGATYGACKESSDIIDPDAVADLVNPVPKDTSNPKDGVPDHAHFVATDLTETPGAFELRGSNWHDVFVDGKFVLDPTETDAAKAKAKQDAEKLVVSILNDASTGGVSNPALSALATRPIALGLWKQKPGCTFPSSKVKPAQAFTGAARPRWLDYAKIPASSPVFEKLPGGAVFDMICVNCHGPKLDSQGRQAETVQTLSGGLVRVANFKDGLFGPTNSPGTNRARVFAPVAGSTAQSDDWGAKYLSWMALGGTQVHIPKAVLQLVSLTDVAGAKRSVPLLDINALSANMLAAAQVACGVFTTYAGPFDVTGRNGSLFGYVAQGSQLIHSNGDAELWQSLCTLNNPPPVRGVYVSETSITLQEAYDPSAFKSADRVGNHRGQLVTGLGADNLGPWCIQKLLENGAPKPVVEKFRHDNAIGGEDLPYCPDGVEAHSWRFDADKKQRWATRGAINAGYAVFVYVDRVMKGLEKPIYYDQCELLQ
jgi:mono/diheme cytochrome c family protein